MCFPLPVTDLMNLQGFRSFGRCRPGSQQVPLWLWRQVQESGEGGETVQDKSPQGEDGELRGWVSQEQRSRPYCSR